MPIIRVEMFKGRSAQQKRELVEVLSRETARITRCSLESVHVLITDLNKENCGVGGLLCSEKFPD